MRATAHTSWHSHKVGGYHMSITNEHAEDARGASRLRSGEGIRLLPALLVSPALASCAQSPSVTGKSELLTGNRQASLSDNLGNKRQTAMLAREVHPTYASVSSVGLASYYSEGARTASGEITNLSTGRSVVARVSDRGPFVPGRVVDVSCSAAGSLGMTEKGTAKVKLDVVQ